MKNLKITKVKPTVIKDVAPIKIENASNFTLMTTDKKGSGANLAYDLVVDNSSTWSVSGSGLII